MVVSRGGRSGLHTDSLPSHTRQRTFNSHQTLQQCASAVLPISRESSARGLLRDIQREVVSSSSANRAPSREPTQCHRARGSGGQRGRPGPYLPERAEGRALLGPAPQDLRPASCSVPSPRRVVCDERLFAAGLQLSGPLPEKRTRGVHPSFSPAPTGPGAPFTAGKTRRGTPRPPGSM